MRSGTASASTSRRPAGERVSPGGSRSCSTTSTGACTSPGCREPIGPGAWLLNLEADPHFTFHLKGSTKADLAATARIITDETERRAVFAEVVRVWTGQDLETMTAYSPLIEVTLDDLAA